MTHDTFEGGDLELRRVLRDLREGPPVPPRARERLNHALLTTAGAPFDSRPATPASSGAGTLAQLVARPSGVWTLGAIGAVAVAGAAWLGFVARDVPRAAPVAAAPTASIVEASKRPIETRGPASVATRMNEPEPASAAPIVSSDGRSEKRPSRDGSLAAERRLLDAARAALVAGDRAAGLDLLTKHARTFPRGVLAEEREALTIDAFVASGRCDEARRRAEGFRSRYPGSLFAPSVAAALAAIP